VSAQTTLTTSTKRRQHDCDMKRGLCAYKNCWSKHRQQQRHAS